MHALEADAAMTAVSTEPSSTTVLSFRLTHEEYALVRQAAQLRHTTKSDVIRQAIRSYLAPPLHRRLLSKVTRTK